MECPECKTEMVELTDNEEVGLREFECLECGHYVDESEDEDEDLESDLNDIDDYGDN